MLRFALGEVVFQNSMEEYLKTYGEKNSSLEQVWKIFTDAANAAKKLPHDTTVEHIMDSWSTKSRYPLFKVERDYETNMVSVTQVSIFFFISFNWTVRPVSSFFLLIQFL